MARDTNRYIRRKNRQCSGLVCLRVSRTLDAEWQNRRSSLARLYDRAPIADSEALQNAAVTSYDRN